MKNIPILDSRLSLAARFVKQDGVVCDVGTDHAYLPIQLILSGRCNSAVACDINEGPLERARINCEKYGVSDRVTLCLCDGLSQVPLSDLSVDNIVICGMGGELIASIIDKCDYVKQNDVRLILQPMSQTGKLREYLCQNGFETVDGDMTKAQGKLYQCIVCRYTGKVHTLSPAELELGAENIKGNRSPVFYEALDKLVLKTQRAIEGRREGGLDTAELDRLLSELLSIS